MKIVVCYVAVSGGSLTHDLAARFVGSWQQCPPGHECSLVVACNGGPLPMETALLFGLLNAELFPRVNDGGYDISAYQQIANEIPCDALCCFGESVYLHRPGWLKKMAEAWSTFGPGMYGFFSSHLVRPHLNTTAFIVAPIYLQQYPKVTNHDQRYEFEHGQNSFWKHVRNAGKPTKLVTWDGAWDPFQWRVPRNILWRGTQENLLAFCSHTDRFRGADQKTKMAWSKWVDGPFSSP